MPELPEVETVCRGIAPFIEGATLEHVVLNRPNLRIPFPEFLHERLQGLTVRRVERLAKYVLIHLSDAKILVIHLGMSGQVKIVQDYAAYSEIKHDHMILCFDENKALVYNDPRRFGMVMLFDDAQTLNADPAFAKMGPDPLGADFSAEILAERLGARRTYIKAALLDQRVVAGLGNIYVCEALFMAGVHPQRRADDISAQEAARLYTAIVEVLQKAIKAGGSTLKDYRSADGKLGYFQNELLVYGREEAPCYQCGKAAIKRIVQSGRSTFYCPSCQADAVEVTN
jgi:formamidopyrimidine-DNA glycosylase